MWEKGEVLNKEIASFTISGREWVNYYWLFEVLVYGCYKMCGYPCIVLFRLLIFIFTGSLLFFVVYRMSRKDLLTTVFLISFVFLLYSARALNIRPHLFSYLFILIFIKTLQDYQTGGINRLYILPILQLFWINLHGVEYPIPFFIIGTYIFQSMIPYMRKDIHELLKSKEFIHLSFTFFACIIVSFVNPFHYKVFFTPGIALTEETMRNISEMIPFKLSQFFSFYPDLGRSFMSFLSVMCIVQVPLVIYALFKSDFKYPLLFFLGVYLMFQRSRFFVEFALMTTPFFAYYFPVLIKNLSPEIRKKVMVVVGVLAFYGFASIFYLIYENLKVGRYRLLGEEVYPVGAVKFIKKEGLKGNVFNSPTYGGYIEWELFPDVKISMDMRTPDPFDNETYWFVRKIMTGEISLYFLYSRWDIDYFLILKTSPIAKKLFSEKDAYALVYVDDKFVIFVKRDRFSEEKVRMLEIRYINPFNVNFDEMSEDELGNVEGEAKRLLNYWAKNTFAYRVLFHIYVKRKDWDSAIGVLDEVRRKARWIALSFFYGKVYFEKGDIERAKKYFEDSVKNENYPESYRHLAETLMSLNDYKGCISVLKRYERLKGFRLKTEEYLLLGDAYKALGELKEAERYYKKAYWKSNEKQEKEVVKRLNEIGVKL